jgi:hypothetical protein
MTGYAAFAIRPERPPHAWIDRARTPGAMVRLLAGNPLSVYRKITLDNLAVLQAQLLFAEALRTNVMEGKRDDCLTHKSVT